MSCHPCMTGAACRTWLNPVVRLRVWLDSVERLFRVRWRCRSFRPRLVNVTASSAVHLCVIKESVCHVIQLLLRWFYSLLGRASPIVPSKKAVNFRQDFLAASHRATRRQRGGFRLGVLPCFWCDCTRRPSTKSFPPVGMPGVQVFVSWVSGSRRCRSRCRASRC